MTYPKVLLHQAVHNRPEYTDISIRSIGERSRYPNLQWVVSDIASDTPTRKLLSELSRQYGFQIMHHKTNVGQWAACQAAWSHSTAPLLSHIQNDIIVPFAWLLSLYQVYQAFSPFLVAAFHFGVQRFPPTDKQAPNGIGIAYVTHIAGTAFLMHRDHWQTYGRIETGHPIFGFTAYQAKAAKLGAKIGYAYPPVKIIHMDENDYPFSLRETTYKAETDRVFMLRHGKPRTGNQWP
jgi:hypothetical protein